MYNIAVIGGSTEHGEACAGAYTIGKLLAQKGVALINGGGEGVMECVSRGAYENEGLIVGIIPGTNPENGNKYLSVSLPTGIGYARNFLIIRAADSVIALQGSSGTLSEASFAITEGKSVISLGDMTINNLKPGDGKFIRISDPEEAVEIAIKEAEIQRSLERSRKSYWNEFA